MNASIWFALSQPGSREEERESYEAWTGNRYIGKSDERKECEYESKIMHRNQHQPLSFVIWFRDVDGKGRSGITKMCSENELRKKCI